MGQIFKHVECLPKCIKIEKYTINKTKQLIKPILKICLKLILSGKQHKINFIAHIYRNYM